MNKVILIGEVVNIFETKENKGLRFGGFLLQERTTYQGKEYLKYYPINLFNEKIDNNKLNNGDIVLVEGKINSRSYTNTKDGNLSYSVSIIGDIITMIKESEKKKEISQPSKPEDDCPF